MLRLGGIRTFREFADIHARYNNAVRRVGADLNVVVVDVEEAFRGQGADHLFLNTDAIHPTDLGQSVEAERMYDQLEASGFPSRSTPRL
jgi:lysophospholipase L1-like esterase